MSLHTTASSCSSDIWLLTAHIGEKYCLSHAHFLCHGLQAYLHIDVTRTHEIDWTLQDCRYLVEMKSTNDFPRAVCYVITFMTGETLTMKGPQSLCTTPHQS